MIRLGLIRHGHTAWNRAGRIQGRTDIPLDGEAEAGLAALRLPAVWAGVDLVASPLARATRTAALIADRAPIPVPALMEMDWGRWEGQHGAALATDPDSGFRHIEAWGWDYTPPDGERVGALRDRVLVWANGLERDTLAVCHIGVMRVLLAVAHGWDFDGPAPFQVKRNRIFGMLRDDLGRWHADGEPIRLETRP